MMVLYIHLGALFRQYNNCSPNEMLECSSGFLSNQKQQSKRRKFVKDLSNLENEGWIRK